MHLKHISKSVLFLFIAWYTGIFPYFVFGQESVKKGISHEGYLEIYGKVMKGVKVPLPEAKIEVLEGFNKIHEQLSSKKGDFSFQINLNSEYLFKVSKPGFVPKSIEITTYVPVEYDENVFSYPFHVEMYELIDTLQQVLNKPAGLIFWIDTLKTFYFDTKYTESFKKEQERLRNKALTMVEQIKLKKDQEAKEEGNRLMKEAQEKANAQKLVKEAEARSEAEKLKLEAEKLGEVERLKKEAEAKAEAERLQREVEEKAKKGLFNKISEEELDRLRKEAEKEGEAIRIRKEAEAKETAEKLKRDAEVEADAIRLLKEAQAKAKSVQLMKEAEAESEALRLMKEAEAESEAARLMKEDREKNEQIKAKKGVKSEQNKDLLATYSEVERQQNISDAAMESERLQKELNAQKELERIKREAEDKSLAQRLQKEAEAKEETMLIMKEAKENVIKVKRQQEIKTQYNKEMVQIFEEVEREEREKLFSKVSSSNTMITYKPEIYEKLIEGVVSNTKYTIVKYPYKQDTLQSVKYVWGNVNYYKNNKPIDKETYDQELVKFKKK